MQNQKEQQKEGNANEKKNQYSIGADNGRLYGRRRADHRLCRHYGQERVAVYHHLHLRRQGEEA